MKRDPKLSEKDIPQMLNSFKRFVRVIQKLYNEPQGHITIQDFKEDGKIVRKKVITSDFEELKKVFDKNKKQQDIIETFRKLHKSVTKDKYGK